MERMREERSALEAGEEQAAGEEGEEEQEKGLPQAGAPVTFGPVSPPRTDPPQRFNLSLAPAETEWWGSPAPAGLAAAGLKRPWLGRWQLGIA